VPAATRIDALGTPCAGAKDREACTRKVDDLLGASSSTGWEVSVATCGGCMRESFDDLGVITTGDDVRLATFEDLVGAVLPIETRDEAAAILALRGRRFDCDDDNVRPESDGWTFKQTSSSCSGAVSESFWKITRGGQLVEAGTNKVSDADSNCIEGRRPANLMPTGVPWLSSITACFSEIAHMEAASVVAFEAIDAQLRALDAPEGLLARVAQARADEVEHAARTTALARRFGGQPEAPRVSGASRDVFAVDARMQLALENAVEGCVREAYGALVAAWQATHSEDAEIRATFAQIAIDEAAHAELSFALDGWLAREMSASDRMRIEDARARAWLDLAAACEVEPAPEVVRLAGMPTAAEARALLLALRDAAYDVAA
jgi:hypothetical protein